MPTDPDSASDLFGPESRTVTFESVRLENVDRFAALMLHHLPAGIAVGLVGTLGAGKTRLVQGLAKAAKVDAGDVTSPTFTLLQSYHGKPNLHHLDAYRIEDEDEFLQLGVDELFDESDAWTLVEWGDRVRDVMPVDTLWIRILIADESDQRVIQVASPSETLESAVRSVLNQFQLDATQNNETPDNETPESNPADDGRP